MPDHKGIHAALLAAHRSFGPVLKNATNPAFRSKYADLSSVIETITEPLHQHDIVWLQPVESGSNGEMILVTELVHVPTGEKVSSHYPIRCKDYDDPQKIGGAVTYARRYSLLALLGLAPEEDDGQAASQAPKTRARPAAVSAPDEAPPAPAAPEPEVVSWTVFWDKAKKEYGVLSKDKFVEMTQREMPNTPQHALNILKKHVPRLKGA